MQISGDRTNLALSRIGKNARFKKLHSSRIVFQNNLAFLGRFGEASLSEFPEIYALYLLSKIRQKVNDAKSLASYYLKNAIYFPPKKPWNSQWNFEILNTYV